MDHIFGMLSLLAVVVAIGWLIKTEMWPKHGDKFEDVYEFYKSGKKAIKKVKGK